MQRCTAKAAGGTRKRLKPGPATVLSRSKNEDDISGPFLFVVVAGQDICAPANMPHLRQVCHQMRSQDGAIGLRVGSHCACRAMRCAMLCEVKTVTFGSERNGETRNFGLTHVYVHLCGLARFPSGDGADLPRCCWLQGLWFPHRRRPPVCRTPIRQYGHCRHWSIRTHNAALKKVQALLDAEAGLSAPRSAASGFTLRRAGAGFQHPRAGVKGTRRRCSRGSNSPPIIPTRCASTCCRPMRRMSTTRRASPRR